jgi:hypothetical protein
MISIPPLSQDTFFGQLLLSIDGEYDCVRIYDRLDVNDPWKQYIQTKFVGNDLNEIHPRLGVWIHMKNDAVLITDTEVPPSDYWVNIPLHPGWNFVGYPSGQPRTVVDALAGVPYTIIYTYDSTSDQWLSYDPGSYSPDNLSELEIGRGYWIYCESFHLWQVYYI